MDSENNKLSSSKQEAIHRFQEHVSYGKAAFFQKYEMDIVMGFRDGPYLWDMDGEKKLFNLHCNGGVFNLGHRNEELIQLLNRSLESLDIGNSHLMSRERADLAALLAGLMPEDLDVAIFGVSGGEAVDVAFKIARAYTGRTQIISALGGYHGHTGLAMAAGDEKYRKPFGPQLPGFIQVPFSDIEALISVANEDTAAVILETVPATLGMTIPSREYLQSVRNLCNEKNILLIMDEVQTGLGRTGKLWAFEHFGIVPDIVVLGKGLSGGIYPITATVIRKPLESIFHEDPFIHVSTFGGAELGCRVAMQVLKISSSPAFFNHVNMLAGRFKQGVERLKKDHGDFLLELRQLGLMMGLKLKDDVSGPVMSKAAYDNGLLMVYANNDTSVCQFLPPLVISLEQVDEVLEKLDKAMAYAKELRAFFLT